MVIENLEFIGMIFSMLGAFMSSFKNDKDSKYILFAYYSFLISDVFLFYMGVMLGMIPFLVQLVFFIFSAINGIAKIKNNIIINKTLFIAFGLLMISGIYLAGIIGSDKISFEITRTEVLAAILAIIGSFFLAYKELRFYSFVLFFLADSIYLYIAYEKHLLYFGIQSFFFLFTSIKGMRNNSIFKQED